MKRMKTGDLFLNCIYWLIKKSKGSKNPITHETRAYAWEMLEHVWNAWNTHEMREKIHKVGSSLYIE